MRRPSTFSFTLFVFIVLLAMSAGRGARAEEVWRCGAQGRSYSDVPCADGRSLWLDDARSAEQVAASRRLAAHEQSLAQRWRAERLAREAAAIAASSAPVAFSSGPGVPVLKQNRLSPQRQPKKQPRLSRGAASETSPAIALASPRRPG